MEIFCNIINVFIVTFDQVNASYSDQNCSCSLSLSLSIYIYIYMTALLEWMQTVLVSGILCPLTKKKKKKKTLHKQKVAFIPVSHGILLTNA